MKKILVVDDESSILRIIKHSLEKSGHSVVCYDNLLELRLNELNAYDLLILDVMLPKMNGFEFLKRYRNELDCPIILLTAKNQESDILLGLGIGADDYITKPFRIAELRARVEAHLRREDRPRRHFYKIDNFKFDINQKTMYLQNRKIFLTKSEYEICEFLAVNRGSVFSKEQIYEKIFGYEGEGDSSSITTHIKNIRQKLTLKKCPIQTIWGVGYLWEKDN